MSLKKQFSKTKPVCKVTFSLPQEAVNKAEQVLLLGEFNDWNAADAVAMKASKKGDFEAVVELATGRNYEFRYLINNETWENDWNADDYIPSPYTGVYNSVVYVDEAKKIVAKKVTAKPAKAKKATKTTAKKTTAKATPKAAAKKDNLRKIEGIGPKIEKLLNEDGVVTFAQLAKSKISFLKAVLEKAGSRFKMHNPSTWAEQAKLAAAGDWTNLEKLQEELNGGKR